MELLEISSNNVLPCQPTNNAKDQHGEESGKKGIAPGKDPIDAGPLQDFILYLISTYISTNQGSH